MATALVAKAPWVAPNTREPTGNLGFATPDGVDRTVPANSAPETHGNAGEVVSTRFVWEAGGLGHTRLVLVFALDLENVEEVGGGSVDLDDIFIWFRPGIGKVRHLELVRSLRTVSDAASTKQYDVVVP